MPLVTLKTNVSSDSLPKDFHVQFTKKLAEILVKPEERISVTVETSKTMARGGTFDPVCEIHIAAIGIDTREKTLPIIQNVTKFIADKTGVPQARIVLWMTSLQPSHVGVNGELMG